MSRQRHRHSDPVPLASFGALVRDDFGGLAVRGFPSGGTANAAAQAAGRDFLLRDADRKPAALGSPAELSKRLGGAPSAKTIWRLCKQGALPCRDDGGGRLARYRLPIRAIVASVMNGGLRATIARQRAGFFGQV